MITLTRITDPAKLDEYFRFRYRIAANSFNRVLLDRSTVLDKDEYDADAIHVGWYQNGELLGCSRLIVPRPGPKPLYSFMLVPEDIASKALLLLRQWDQQGTPYVEVSRSSLSEACRNLKMARQYFLALMAFSYEQGYTRSLFTCHKHHVPLWLRLGLRPLAGTAEFNSPMGPSWCMVYDHSQLPEQIQTAIDAYRSTLYAKAA